MGGNRRKKRCIKDSNLWDPRHQVRDSADTGQVDWIMQNSQLGKFLDGLNNSSINQNRFGKGLSTVNYSMPYRANFGKILNDS